MTPKSRIILAVVAIAITTLTLNARWVSNWAEEAKGTIVGRKPYAEDTYRAVSPNGDIKSVACSADGKTLYVVCAEVWIKGPTPKGTGGKLASAVLFKSTNGGETWSILTGD